MEIDLSRVSAELRAWLNRRAREELAKPFAQREREQEAMAAAVQAGRQARGSRRASRGGT